MTDSGTYTINHHADRYGVLVGTISITAETDDDPHLATWFQTFALDVVDTAAITDAAVSTENRHEYSKEDEAVANGKNVHLTVKILLFYDVPGYDMAATARKILDYLIAAGELK